MSSAPVASEVEHLEMNAMYSAQGQFEQSKLWRSVNLLLGAPAAALAAAAGGTVLATATNHVIAGALALAAAGLGAVVTAVGAQRRASHATESGNAYLALQTDARQLRLIDLEALDRVEARTRLHDLTERCNKVNATADPPSFYAYWRGKRNIEKGRQKHPELQHPQGP